MLSTQEYYEMVKSRRNLIFYSQMESCLFALLSSLEDFGTSVLTGHFEVELEFKPLPEFISELSNLGYANIKFYHGKTASLNTVGTLSFDVPELVRKASTSSQNTL